MAAPVPEREPLEITAGDTATWSRSLSDYPASAGWVLSYAFLPEGGGQQLQFSGSASGDSHLIAVSAADTNGWADGEYVGQGYVTLGAVRAQVWTGHLTVRPNFANGNQTDPRSKAKKILDFIDASFSKLAQKQVSEAVIEGVQLRFRTMKELQDARNYWATIVAREQGASRRVILSRFVRPGCV